jgi:hypothetical protein
MPVREFLDITVESAYKTAKTSPVLNTDRFVIRLDADNSFTMRPDPQAITMPYGGGFAVDAFDVSDTVEIKGSLTVKPTYTQMVALLGLGLVQINADQDSPWVTTEPIGDLASVSIRHAIYQDDTGTYKRKAYRGVKNLGGKFDISRESKVATLQLDLQAASVDGSDPDGTAFPVPGDTNYTTDLIKFSHSTLSLGASITEYESLSFAWQNKFDALWFASPNLAKMRLLGRTSSLTAGLVYNSTPDFRAAYEALTVKAASLAFDGGALSFALDYQGKNRVKTVEDVLAQMKVYRQTVTLESRYDTATSTDFALTFGT